MTLFGYDCRRRGRDRVAEHDHMRQAGRIGMDHRANQRVRVESDGDAEEPSVCTAFLGEGTFEQIGSLLTDRGFDSRCVSDRAILLWLFRHG